jgi:hypothetical protein
MGRHIGFNVCLLFAQSRYLHHNYLHLTHNKLIIQMSRRTSDTPLINYIYTAKAKSGAEGDLLMTTPAEYFHHLSKRHFAQRAFYGEFAVLIIPGHTFSINVWIVIENRYV